MIDLGNMSKSTLTSVFNAFSKSSLIRSFRESIDLNFLLLREYKYKPPETIMSLRLEQIVENMVNYVVSFMENYNGKLYEVDLEYKLMGEEQTFFSKVKRYYLAFILHLQDKDNKLYFGIVLLTMSIILYLFNITR